MKGGECRLKPALRQTAGVGARASASKGAEDNMPTLTIRDVPTTLVRSLKALSEAAQPFDGAGSPGDAQGACVGTEIGTCADRVGWIAVGRPENVMKITAAAVADTNVIAYLLLGTQKYAEEASAFLATGKDLCAPAHWEAELGNVLGMATRHKVLTVEEATERLALADRLGVHSVPSRTLWQGALVRAGESGVAVNDTLFVELAMREKVPLVTFDAGLIRAFPKIAVRPGAVHTG